MKAISKFYGITIDELLSGEELLSIAEEDSKEKQVHQRDLIFGLLDCSVILFFFLPFFGQSAEGAVEAVSLLSLSQISPYLKFAYIAVVAVIVIWGILTLTLQNFRNVLWLRHKEKISFVLGAAGELLLIIGSQPYAATFLFVFLIIKVLISRNKL